MAQIAHALGAEPVPRTRFEARRLFAAMRLQLRCDTRTREVARLVLSPPAPNPIPEPVQTLVVQAAIDLLPIWARRMHGLDTSSLNRLLVRTGTLGLAQTLRWAFA